LSIMDIQKKYLIGVDVGTTSQKVAVFDTDGNTLAAVNVDYILDTRGNTVEFDALEYISILRRGLTAAAWKAFPGAGEEELRERVAAISIDTQGETLIVTDGENRPLRPAIVWLDNRADAQAKAIDAHFGRERVYEVTGQPEIVATWPACKLAWLRENEPEMFSGTERIFLLEDWLLWALSGQFVTEPTVQSSTIYLDIKQRTWWGEMLDEVGISERQLPRIVPSGTVIGYADAAWLCGGGVAGVPADGGIPVVTGALDQVAGAIGAGVVREGIVSEMTGTTMTVFAPTGGIPPYDASSIVPCHLTYDGSYALLSWTPTAGIALKWFRNKFCPELSFAEIDALAEQVEPGSAGLVFLPYLCGSTMPKYDPDARGVFYGLTMEHGREHMARAILESVAAMLRATLDYLDVRCDEIRTMGGGALSPLWCGIKADMCGRRLVTLKNTDTACLGAAILGGVGVGLFPSVEEACDRIVATDREYIPEPSAASEAAYRAYVAADDRIYPQA